MVPGLRWVLGLAAVVALTAAAVVAVAVGGENDEERSSPATTTTTATTTSPPTTTTTAVVDEQTTVPPPVDTEPFVETFTGRRHLTFLRGEAIVAVDVDLGRVNTVELDVEVDF